MKVEYFEDSDTLYIGFSDGPSTESEEVSPGVVLDFDASGRVVGIEVQHAGALLDLSRVEFVPFGRLSPGATGPLTG